MALGDHLQRPWNKWNQVPMSTWLKTKQDTQDRGRLHQLGNMVVPQCATLGFHVLLRMLAEARASNLV